jgi:hypothetical protein
MPLTECLHQYPMSGDSRSVARPPLLAELSFGLLPAT